MATRGSGMTERLPLLVHNCDMPSTSRRTAAKTAPPRGTGRPAPTKGRGAERDAAASNGGSSERRHALVEIAAALFAEQGFKATTVREIGDAAGVLSGSLYHHFDSKETIVDEILSSYLDSLMQTYREIVGS